MAAGNEDWVARTASDVIAEAKRRHPGAPPTCASGISPSGPVHLGNLRELMTPHLVANEVRRAGHECRHILSWDDYDRLRRVPAGYPESFAEHIGRPLSAVPDPVGDCHVSWAEHFKDPLRTALDRLGVRLTEISQTAMYESGAYLDSIITAMRRRDDIGAIIRRYQTKRDNRAVTEEDEYYPFKPYCATCGRDDTTVTAFDDDTAEITYTCGCGAKIGPVPIAGVRGKLVWKVDWPMRWAYERVTFEPAGVDHSSPGSSFTVGQHLVEEIFGGQMPLHFMYAFVGFQGQAKISSSRGSAPTALDALEVLEAPLLRWLYVRRRPEQSFNIAFDAEILRTYDEWDALSRKVAADTAEAPSVAIWTRSATTAEGPLARTARPLPFRTLASVSDVAAGDDVQVLRILRDLTMEQPVRDLAEVRPRLDCAQAWVAGYVPEGERTHVRSEPDRELLASLPEQDRTAIGLLADRMGTNWSQDGLTTLLYGIPKLVAGLPIDAAPTPELKVAQRQWFILLYRLLVSADTGPRLPTLLLALGEDRVRSLIAPSVTSG